MTILILYSLVCLYFYQYQNRMLFHPDMVPKTHPDILAPYVFDWQHDGLKHHGWYIHGALKKPLLVYLGGNSEIISKSIVKYYERFHDNYDILALEYRGFGGSEGMPSEKHLVEDTIALLTQWMTQYGYKAEDIVLIGRSLGSGVAVQVASRIQPKGIILVTPFDSVNALASAQYPYIPIALLNNNGFESDKYASQIDIPGLLIIAGNDSVTPPAHGLRLAHLMGRKPWIATITGATHSNIYNHLETWYDIKLFLKALFDKKSGMKYLNQAHYSINTKSD